MKYFKLFILALSITVLLTPAFAANARPAQGDVLARLELSPFGASTGATQPVMRGIVFGEEFFSFGALGGVGYFFTNNLEIGGQGGIAYFKPDNFDGRFSVPLLAVARYHIPITEPLGAFFGGGGGIVINDPGDLGLSLNGQGGIEYFLVKAWALHATGFIDIYNENTTLFAFGATYGVSAYF